MTTIKGLLIQPDGSIHDTVLEPQLARLQELVGGYIEPINGSGWCAYVDGDGNIKGLPRNPVADAVAKRNGWRYRPGAFLVGPVLFLGPPSNGKETSVPESLVDEAVTARLAV